jgi:hypothetical protein
MRKTILTILGAALLAASTMQIAAAAEHHKARKIDRAPAPVSEPIRNSRRSLTAELNGGRSHPVAGFRF